MSGAGPHEPLGRLLGEIDALTPEQVETIVRLGPALIAAPDRQGVVADAIWATVGDLHLGARLLDATLLVERRAATHPAVASHASDEQWIVLEALRGAVAAIVLEDRLGAAQCARLGRAWRELAPGAETVREPGTDAPMHRDGPPS